MATPRILALVSLLGALAAQAPQTSARIHAGAEPFSGVWVDTESAPGTVWVRGETYRARFTKEGAVDFPLLGPRTEKDFRFATRLASASLGSTLLAERADVPVRFTGRTARYGNGPVEEVYECRPTTIEHSFVVAERFGEGDLVVRVAVETEYAFVSQDEAVGLLFALDGYGTLAYGVAKAFDAAGHEVRFAPRWRDGIIELVVPAAFVAAATFPLTIDPIISTTALSTTLADEVEADVAYDATTQTWLVVYQETVSGNDSNIKVRRYSDAGALLELSFAESSTDDAARPRVANNGTANQFLIVWSHVDSLVASSIRGRHHAAATSSYGAPFTVASGSAPGRRPASATVGGTAVAGADRYLVTWLDEKSTLAPTTRVLACTVSTGAALGAVVELDNQICVGEPNVNKSALAAANWLVTWDTASVLCFTARDVYYAVMGSNGAVLQPRTLVIGQAGDNGRPAVGGNGTEFVVVWEQQQGASSIDYDIMGAIVRKDAAGAFPKVGGAVNLSKVEPNNMSVRIQGDASIDFDGRRYALSYSESTATASIYGATLMVVGNSIVFVDGHVVLSPTLIGCSSSNFACQGGSGGPLGRSMAVWQQVSANAGGGRDIFSALYDAVPGTDTRVQKSARCRLGGQPILDVTPRSPGIGLPLSVTMTGFTGTPFLFLGSEQPPTVFCSTTAGTCRLFVNPVVTFASPTFAMTIPNDVGLYGLVLGFQGVDVGVPNACPSTIFGVPFATSDALFQTVQ